MEDGVDRFFEWEERTKALCEAGAAGNALIDRVYAEGAEHDLLERGSPLAEAFAECTASRATWWRQRLTPERVAAWSDELAAGLTAARRAKDRLGVVRHLCWLKHSTLRIASDPRLTALAEEDWLLGLEREATKTFTVASRYESSPAFVRRHRRKLFGTVYRIHRPGELPRYAEVVETWQFAPTERITMCLPLTVGCPHVCPMCEFGTYDGGHLSPDEILRMVELNLEANRDVPIGGDLTLYYLGGGDAGAHPHVRDLVTMAPQRFTGVTQILSTIAPVGSLDDLVDRCAETDRVGLQISIGSFDEALRRKCVGGVDVEPLDMCARALTSFHRRSGRKGYASIFLLPGNADPVERARAAFDPRATHITLTVLRPNDRRFTERQIDRGEYEKVRGRLQQAGFECSVSTNDEDPDNEVSCGRSSRIVLHGNTPFFKR